MNPTLSAPTGLLGAPTGELVLKICGGEHDGRVLRLTAAKCLIGSAPGCTLRLRARGIRPVHALIMRGTAGTIIRSWSNDTQLNERAFAEALLEAGDKIQIGPITLSVDELAQGTPSPRVLPPSSPEPIEAPPRRSTRNRRKQLFGALRQERQQHVDLKTTINNQREQLASFEQQIEKLQSAVQNATTNSGEWAVAQAIEIPDDADRLNQQLAKTIAQLRKELDAAAKRRTMEQQTAARQRATAEEQLQQRHQAELAEVREQLKSQQQLELQAATANASEKLQQQLIAAEQQRASLARDLESLKAALDAKTKSEELGRQAIASQLEQLSQAYDLVSQERDELFERLHAEQQTFDGQSFDLQSQLAEVRRDASAEIAEVQTAAQVQISQLRSEFARREQQFDEELIARTSSEGMRSAADAERIQALTAELETIRSEAKTNASSQSQQQEGFTQARKRLEAEIAALNQRLKQSEEAVHEARANSGQLQSAVLAEAEQARAQRDGVREQMLRQQQDWTEFRSRLELAANEERDLARTRYASLEKEFEAAQEQCLTAKAESESLQTRLGQLQIELEQSQEALFAAEHGVNQRLQQMTVSMESLQLDRTSEQSQLDQERAEFDRERNELAQCVTDLQHEVTRLTAELQTVAQAQASQADDQLQVAQAQLAEWQTTAEQAREQAAELSQAVTKFRQQEQIWQLEREQLDFQQQSSNERLQQLEASITELQQQLDEAQRAVAVTCPPPAMVARQPQPQDFGGTININNQDLAALCEQANEAAPALLAPRLSESLDTNKSAALQAREEALHAQAQELAEQQTNLEEEQAIVARQRIELESFHASLLELERSLTERAEQLLHPAPLPDPNASYVSADFHDHSYGAGPDRESNPLSESEAFAAMADQVAALYKPEVEAAPALLHGPEDVVEEHAEEEFYGNIIPSSPVAEDFAAESLIISSPTAEQDEACQPIAELPTEAPAMFESVQPESAAVIAPSDADFDQQLEARIARVMRRERTDWSTPTAEATPEINAPESAEETPPPTQSQAVNSVLDRLKEAGLWKGEGTAKADQLPSSSPPIDEGGPGLCRLSQVGPIGAELADQVHNEAADEEEVQEEEEADNLSLLSRPSPTRATLAEPPAKEDESDDSIESYMSRLMQRLKTTSGEEEPAPKKQSGGNASRQPAAAKPAAAPTPAPKPTDSKPLTSLSEIAPRSQAPELNANLAAMRELANSAARGAIETHRTKNKQQRVNMRTINTLMALLVAAGFTFMWTRTGSFLALGGITLSMVWAVGSSAMAGMSTLMLRQEKRDAAAAESADEDKAEEQTA
ncbi:FHA domain-containing protein [Anatilimnocola floriformis]|uniref:FHA domain-containing protein n=1 Tax=Anatilimnocola floriformis TaxID=2948575 RepID=UPI0020C5461A|nr:FHA domain-containing protein [Anatilimnocola floriformis]